MIDPLYVGEKISQSASRAGFIEHAALLNSVERTMVKISNSQPSVIQSWSSYNASIYLSRDEKILQLSFDTWNTDLIAKKFGEISQSIGDVEKSFLYAPLPDPDPSARPLEGGYDHTILKIMEDPSDIAESLINRALDEGVERVAGVIDLGVGERCLLTSKGFRGCERKTFVAIHLRSFKGEGSGHWGYGSRIYSVKDAKEVAIRSAEYARLSTSRRDIEPGKVDAILSPMVFGELWGSFVMGFTGFAYIVGNTFLKDRKPGDRIASEKLSVADKPLKQDLMGSSGFDDEGIATRNTYLIEKGVLRSLLHNTKTARYLGTSSTGNAGWVVPRPWSLSIEPGDMDEEELLRELRRGILVNNNWYTRYHNFVEGVFSTVLRDAILVVENGEIKGAVRRMRIADTVANLINNIEALGRRVYKVKWWEISVPIEAPFILVRGIRTSR